MYVYIPSTDQNRYRILKYYEYIMYFFCTYKYFNLYNKYSEMVKIIEAIVLCSTLCKNNRIKYIKLKKNVTIKLIV